MSSAKIRLIAQLLNQCLIDSQATVNPRHVPGPLQSRASRAYKNAPSSRLHVLHRTIEPPSLQEADNHDPPTHFRSGKARFYLHVSFLLCKDRE